MTHSPHTNHTPGRILVYTAIFGKKDILHEPRVLVRNCDFVCITDQPFRSTNWRIRYTPAPFPDDLTRSNRMYKILAHKFFPEYERSVYIDGNMIVRGNLNELVEEALRDANMAFYDRSKIVAYPSSSIVDEAEKLVQLSNENKSKDDPKLIQSQVEHYRQEGYPVDHEMITGMVIVRRHNMPDVMHAMEAWWGELLRWSRRDQLSFPYISWRLGVQHALIRGDSTNNKYFYRMPHRRTFFQIASAYYQEVRRRLVGLFEGR